MFRVITLLAGVCFWVLCLIVCPEAQGDGAAYLVEENFCCLHPYCTGIRIISGWEVDKSGGGNYYDAQRYGHNSFDFWVTSGLTMGKWMACQTSGTVVLEFRFNVNTKADGLTWQLRRGNSPAVKILTSNGNLCYENSSGAAITLQTYSANAEVGVKVAADISSKKADIYVNGVLRASNVDFRNNVRGIDYFYMSSGAAGNVILHQRCVHVYKKFIVNEMFISGGQGNVPEDWSVDSSGGTVRVVKNEEAAPPPDFYSVRMDDASGSNSVSMAKAFASQTGKVEFEYKFMQPVKKDGFMAEIGNGLLAAAKIVTDNGNLCCENSGGSRVSVWNGYAASVWYFVRVTVDLSAHTADIYINDIKKASGVSFANTSVSSVDKVKFTTSASNTDVVWLDDIQVYPFQSYPADYVPEPVPVLHPPYRVGALGCNLWREGSAYSGWDWIASCPSRIPILGFYDEGNTEVADWEIKFMVDHGIDFISPCWYRPQSGFGAGPIKDQVISAAGLQGYRRAKYAGYINYSLIIECANMPMKSMNDWKLNVVPFLIEHYFKDPRYLVVDNKPIVEFYGGLNGTGDNVAGMNYLRDQCVAAGFAGVTGIGCTRTGDQGFEYTYNYCTTYNPESAPMHISSPSVNWDPSTWEAPYGTGGMWRSATEYESLLVAQKRLMPVKTALGQTLMFLDNWNEFAEGHFLLPTQELGYRYLDALRRVFGDGSAHTDIMPTAQQKARLNLLYRNALTSNEGRGFLEFTLQDSVTHQNLTTSASVELLLSGIKEDSSVTSSGTVKVYADSNVNYTVNISAPGYLPKTGIPVIITHSTIPIQLALTRQPLTGINLQYDTVNIGLNAPCQIRLYGVYADGANLPLYSTVVPVWVSRSPELVSVSNSGVLSSYSQTGECFVVAGIASLGFLDSSLICVSPVYNSNLAILATAKASSTQGESQYNVNNVNDGIATTDFNSWASTETPAWLQLDFGAKIVSFNRVELYTTTGYELKDYAIQYWYGTSWVNAAVVTGNTLAHRSTEFSPVTSTKTRVYATTGSAAQPNYARICELEIYNGGTNGLEAEGQNEQLSLSVYPSPFNPATCIRYNAPRTSARIELSIYDAAGHIVRKMPGVSGSHSVMWNGEDNSGRKVSSGVYIVRLKVGNQVVQRRGLFVK